jgi:hypothetical protein
MHELKSNKISFMGLIRRYHLVSFIVIIVLCLSAAVFLLYQVVEKASGAESVGTGASASGFDKETIQRIEQLKTPDEASEPLDLSRGRISPFNE